MSRLDDVLKALVTQVNNAINNAGITTPNQVGIGWPNYEDLTKIITAGECQVTVYTDKTKGGAKNTSRFFPRWQVMTQPQVNLTATVVGNTITFTGSVPISGSTLNIHTLGGSPLVDSLYQTHYTDQISNVCAGVAQNYNLANVPGSGAIPGTSTVEITGSPYVICNVGGSGTLATEALRIKRDVSVIVWAFDEWNRQAIEGAILQQVGTIVSPRLSLSDGTQVWIRFESSVWSDEDELDFSAYRSTIWFMVEYPELVTTSATQIGAIKETISNGYSSQTITIGE